MSVVRVEGKGVEGRIMCACECLVCVGVREGQKVERGLRSE